jgi:hypothetical protein
MIPVAAIPIIKVAVASTTAKQLIQNAPAAIAFLKTSEPKDWSESDMQLVEQFYNKLTNFNVQNGQALVDNAVRFQELSHAQIMETFAELDLSKLDAVGTAKVAETTIKENHKTSRFNTIATVLGVTAGVLAAFSSANNASNNNYNLRRPRSVSEKLFGDKK